MCKIISVCNQKGGTGKSASAVNLGIGLARAGQRVLVLDNDPQGSLTASLGFDDPDSMEYTLATVMGKIINEEYIDPKEGILHHQEGIDLIPGNIELSGMDLTLVSVMSREYVLAEYLEKIKENYDWAIIDCGPSLGMLTINALAASDSILIPVQVGYLPVKGLEQLIRTINKVRKQKINHDLQIEGILLTMVDGRTNYSKEIVRLIEQTYGNNVKIFEKSIPLSVRVAECSALGISIYKNDPKGKAALGYESLTREIMANAGIGGACL
ncbi:MAG: ParA family protein [Lachnospiraceae bacterium]|nr:ParA family protein [Lachnospiraceae bacterium]